MTHLLDHHRKQLEDSVIAAEVIEERGYYSATTRAELQRLGFGRAQCNVPGMVIPIYDTQGDLRLYQFRPDTPRVKDGRTIKYETPAKAGLVLDVPRSIRDRLGDPGVPLWITEGSKKVDAAISHGLVCIGVVGVYGWRGTNDAGGKTALSDLEYIAWNDRKVYLAFDSDAMEKREVHQALERFAALLAGRGARVLYIYIPSTDGRKVGLDDYLADGGTVDELLRTATDVLHALPSDDPDTEPEWEPDERALAAGKLLLGAPDLMERIGGVIRALGVAGDLTNSLILYLAFVSRFLTQPINILVLGPSSGGKSHLVKTVAAMLPERAIYVLDAMSERALVYIDADLRWRHLIITEAAGMHPQGIGATIMRAIAWGGRVRYATVEKTGGGLRPVNIDREGPTGIITTSTRRVEPELETRLLTLQVADTADVTRAILTADAVRRNGHAPESPDLEPWHALQYWLALEGSHDVTIPYGERLAELVPVELVRMRRDWTQLMNLISASAILHQRQRERDESGRIKATREDYELVFDLTADLFGEIRAEGVTPAIRETVLAVKMQTGDKPHCSIAHVAGHLKLARSTADSRVRTALKGGWIVNSEESRGRPAKLEVGEPLPEDRPALPIPAELFNDHHTHPTPGIDSSRRHVARSVDSDAANERDDSVRSDESQSKDVTMCRERDEPLFVTLPADSHAENIERDDVTINKQGGLCAQIEINFGRFKTCRACGGHDWWWTVDKGPADDHCLDCDPPPADARIERKVGIPA